MQHSCVVLGLVAILAASALSASDIPLDDPAIPETDREPTGPIPIDLVEEENVRLIVLDVLVLDSKGPHGSRSDAGRLRDRGRRKARDAGYARRSLQ